MLKTRAQSNLIKEKQKIKFESVKMMGIFLLSEILRKAKPRLKKPKRMNMKKLC